jgi:hypothetical protein
MVDAYKRVDDPVHPIKGTGNREKLRYFTRFSMTIKGVILRSKGPRI